MKEHLDLNLTDEQKKTLAAARKAQAPAMQDLHEKIRKFSLIASNEVKMNGGKNNLLDNLKSDPAFKSVDLSQVMNSKRFIGRSVEQVDAFLLDVVAPIRLKYKKYLGQVVQLRV